MVKEKQSETVNEEELSADDRQEGEYHPLTTMKKVLVGIDSFNFPIDIVTLGI